MLRDEAGTQHLDALARNFLDDGSVVHEPPAPERKQIAELPRKYAEFVLIFAAQHTDQETVGGKIAAEIFYGAHVCAADSVPGKANARVDLFADAYHQGQRKPGFPASRKNGLLENSPAKRIVGIQEAVGKRACKVNGPHARNPVREKAADLRDGPTAGAGLDGIPLRFDRLPVLGPQI